MKLGEKLQRLRKQSGLSQEQLAARITVSRQAVSKWELDETMPDTDNVVQLSRLFGVSCDYLLREEVDEQGAALAVQDEPVPTPPEKDSLWQQNQTFSAFALSLGVCSFGLVAALMFYRFNGHTVRPLAIGFMIQILGVALFERSASRAGTGRSAARMNFYMIVCWLMLPSPVIVLAASLWEFFRWRPLQALSLYFTAYLLLGAAITAALYVLQRRAQHKN